LRWTVLSGTIFTKTLKTKTVLIASARDLAYLGFDPSNSFPERSLVSLKAESNLYLVSGIARQIARRPWSTNPAKHGIHTLLDCGLPIVISENARKDESSAYLGKEGEFLVTICLLFGSVAFSGVPFRTPIIGRVKKFTPLRVIPPATLLEIELQPTRVIPELRVSYHGEQIRTTGTAPPQRNSDRGDPPEKSLY
jgi:hypothetical protein